jgi:hypothetical protein
MGMFDSADLARGNQGLTTTARAWRESQEALRLKLLAAEAEVKRLRLRLGHALAIVDAAEDSAIHPPTIPNLEFSALREAVVDHAAAARDSEARGTGQPENQPRKCRTLGCDAPVAVECMTGIPLGDYCHTCAAAWLAGVHSGLGRDAGASADLARGTQGPADAAEKVQGPVAPFWQWHEDELPPKCADCGKANQPLLHHALVGQGCDGEDDYIRICQECIGKRKEASRIARLKAEVKPGDVVEAGGTGGVVTEVGTKVWLRPWHWRACEPGALQFTWDEITRHWPAKKEEPKP